MFSKRSLIAGLVAASFAGVSPAETVSYSFSGTVNEQYLVSGVLAPNVFLTNPEWIGDSISGTLTINLAAAPEPNVQTGFYGAGGTTTPSWLRISVTNPDGSSFVSDSFASVSQFAAFRLQIYPGDPVTPPYNEFVTNTAQNLIAGGGNSAELNLTSRSSPSALIDSANPSSVNVDVSQANFNNYGRISSFPSTAPGDGYDYFFTVNSLTRDVVVPPPPPPVSAIPEPQTYALMLAGLAMCAFVVRRRRSD